MSKNDLRVQNIQVDVLENLDPTKRAIVFKKRISGDQIFALELDTDYVQKFHLETGPISKTVLDIVSSPLIIDWQNDEIPGDGRTFAEKHGDSIAVLEGAYEDSGSRIGYKPNYSYTFTGALIGIVTITDLFPGKLTII